MLISWKTNIKLEDEHVEKSFFYGQTYVNAYLKSSFRSREGFCRVFDNNDIVPKRRTELPLSQLKKQRGYFIYYWMTEQGERLNGFRNAYLNLDAKDFVGKTNLLYNEARATNRRDWQNL